MNLSATPPQPPLQAQLDAALAEIQRLRGVIDGSAAGTWEWNPQTDEMRVNPRWAEIVGYSLDELEPVSSDTFVQLVHPDDLQRSDAALSAHLKGDIPFYECLVRMRHRQGHWVWVQDRGRVLEWDAQGGGLWMAGAHADVTDLQQARQDVSAARQRLQSIVDASDEVAIIVTDLAGTITLFNSGAERLLGYQADEVVGQARPTLFHDAQDAQRFLQSLPADEKQDDTDLFGILSERARAHTFSRQWTFLRKDGRQRQVRLSVSALTDAQRDITGFVGMATDVTEVLQARAEARLAEEKFAGAFTSAALGMALVSLEGRWLDVNEALCRILGYSRDELLQVDFQRLTHPDDLDADLQLVDDLLRGNRVHYHLDKRYIRRDGHLIWARLSVSLIRSELGEPLHFVSQIQDVTSERASELRVLEAEARSRVTLDAVTDLVLSVDLQGRIEHANAAAVRALRVEGSLHGQHVSEVIQLTTEYAPHSVLDPSVLLDAGSNAVDLHSDLLLVQEGVNMPVDVSQAWLHDDAGRLRGAVWVIRDVTQLRARQREARQLAELDPLTELINRRGFDAHLQQAIAHLERTGQAASLMFIDLDEFKPVNDTYGHLAGDAVLWAVANVLRQGVRDSDVVARLGGDEFAVILVGCSLRRARRIAGELLHGIGGLSIPWEQHTIRVGASIGIASIRAGMSVDEAVAAADVQCYRAKASGRNTVQSETDGGTEFPPSPVA